MSNFELSRAFKPELEFPIRAGGNIDRRSSKRDTLLAKR
jgi:hypothetical protein